jgi:hypothetical protein
MRRSRRVVLARETQAAIRRVLSDEYLHRMLCEEIISRVVLAYDIVSDLICALSSAESEMRLRSFQKLKGSHVGTELESGNVRSRYCQIITKLCAMGSKLSHAHEMILEIDREIQKYVHTFDQGLMAAGIKIKGVRFSIELTLLLAIEWRRDSKALRKLLSRVFQRWRLIDDPRKDKNKARFGVHEAAAEFGHDRIQTLDYLERTGCFGEKNTSIKLQDARLAWIGQIQSRDVRYARARVARLLADYLERNRDVKEGAGLRFVLQAIKGKPTRFQGRPAQLLTAESVLHDFFRFEVEER